MIRGSVKSLHFFSTIIVDELALDSEMALESETATKAMAIHTSSNADFISAKKKGNTGGTQQPNDFPNASSKDKVQYNLDKTKNCKFSKKIS